MALAKDIVQRQVRRSSPLSAMLELSDRCNEVCVHCYQIHGQKGEMDTLEVKQLMDQLAELGVLFLTLSGGEVTLRKDFLELVAYARAKQFCVTIFTNGLRVDQSMAKQFAKLAVHEVQISLYSPDAQKHDTITGVKGSWNKTVDAIRYLVAEKVSTLVKTPAMKENVHDYASYVELVESLGARHMVGEGISAREDGDRAPSEHDLDHEDIIALRKARGTAAQDRHIPITHAPCGACQQSVHIEANGEIRPCTQLQVPLGDARQDRLSDVYAEGSEVKFIRSLRWADIHGCRDCDLRHYCKRCYASALAENGDALGPYLEACRKALTEYQLIKNKKFRLVKDGQVLSEAVTGPFKQRTNELIECVEDHLMSEDKQLRARHSWITAKPTAQPLLQIGRKTQ
ncbi:MAG: radical SAM protein [Myxococcales bacterium]|nr:MAG: radical SAM protein [Myxococcales bacterium]